MLYAGSATCGRKSREVNWIWLSLALLFALGDWYCVAAGKIKLRIVTKPVVMLALLAGFWQAGGWQDESYWFGLGLVFSLAGDVLLMLPPRFFMAALSSFLLCHVFFIIGFSQGLTALGWGIIIPVAALMVTDFFVYRRLRRVLLNRPRGRWIRFPLHLYQIVISLMAVMAALTLWQTDCPPRAAWLASGGALLLYTSDTLLAFNRFVGASRGGKLLVITSYHLGQMALISGVLLRG